MTDEITGDPVIAEMYRKTQPKPPVEKILRTDIMATAFNRDKLGNDPLKRVVELECGHRTITRNKTKAPCHECHRMMLNGEDYDAFRNRRDDG